MQDAATTHDPRLEMRAAGDKGRGVFTRLPISSGSLILPLGGRHLPTRDLSDDLLALQVGPDLWLCSDGSLLDDMINHSCDANAGFLDGTPVLYALRDIAAGEEICWDYSTSIAEPGWTLACRCGSDSCRGIIRPWGELSTVEQTRLRNRALQYLR
jgi:uncharacterized protein